VSVGKWGSHGYVRLRGPRHEVSSVAGKWFGFMGVQTGGGIFTFQNSYQNHKKESDFEDNFL